MARNAHPETLLKEAGAAARDEGRRLMLSETELSEEQLRDLERGARHERVRRSVEYAIATATHRDTEVEAHRRGFSPVLCKALEGEEKDTNHRWAHKVRRLGQEWRCSRCHLWLIGLPRAGREVFEALYSDNDFSPYVSSLVRGGRELLFSKCDPAESRRQLAAKAREYLAFLDRQEEQRAKPQPARERA